MVTPTLVSIQYLIFKPLLVVDPDSTHYDQVILKQLNGKPTTAKLGLCFWSLAGKNHRVQDLHRQVR